MTIRRSLEEVDSDGRRPVSVTEDPLDAADREVAGEEEILESPPDPWNVARGRLRMVASLVAVAFAVVALLLVSRLSFLLAGANANNGFVDLIYDVTDGWVSPFDGIFAERTVDGGVFEPAALIAIAVYTAVTGLVIALLFAVSTAPSTSSERTVTKRTRQRLRTTRSG